MSAPSGPERPGPERSGPDYPPEWDDEPDGAHSGSTYDEAAAAFDRHMIDDHGLDPLLRVVGCPTCDEHTAATLAALGITRP